MKNFRILVTFRHNNFTRHNAGGELKGEITVTTDRCDIEPILANMNVQSYQIVGCHENGIEVKNQLMNRMIEMPKHYYTKERK